jgi:transcriptional regulator with XRE-family HTH domain
LHVDECNYSPAIVNSFFRAGTIRPLASVAVASRGPMGESVATIVEAAKRKSGKALELINRLEPLVGRRYDESTVSAWMRGRSMPPGDVLLALAKVAGESVDEVIGLSEERRELTVRIRALERQMQRVIEVIGPLATDDFPPPPDEQ